MVISFESKGQSYVYKFCLYSILYKIKKKIIVFVKECGKRRVVIILGEINKYKQDEKGRSYFGEGVKEDEKFLGVGQKREWEKGQDRLFREYSYL